MIINSLKVRRRRIEKLRKGKIVERRRRSRIVRMGGEAEKHVHRQIATPPPLPNPVLSSCMFSCHSCSYDWVSVHFLWNIVTTRLMFVWKYANGVARMDF